MMLITVVNMKVYGCPKPHLTDMISKMYNLIEPSYNLFSSGNCSLIFRKFLFLIDKDSVKLYLTFVSFPLHDYF